MAHLITCDECGAVLCTNHSNQGCGCGPRHVSHLVAFRHEESADQELLTFCTWTCLSAYATARVLVESAEPEP